MEDPSFNTKVHHEAIRRMRILGTKQKIIDKFDANESIPLITLYRTDYHQVSKKHLKRINEIEKQYGVKVYMAIRKFAYRRSVISLLYVSNNEKNWPAERNKLKTPYPFYNLFDVNILRMIFKAGAVCVDDSDDVFPRIWITK